MKINVQNLGYNKEKRGEHLYMSSSFKILGAIKEEKKVAEHKAVSATDERVTLPELLSIEKTVGIGYKEGSQQLRDEFISDTKAAKSFSLLSDDLKKAACERFSLELEKSHCKNYVQGSTFLSVVSWLDEQNNPNIWALYAGNNPAYCVVVPKDGKGEPEIYQLNQQVHRPVKPPEHPDQLMDWKKHHEKEWKRLSDKEMDIDDLTDTERPELISVKKKITIKTSRGFGYNDMYLYSQDLDLDRFTITDEDKLKNCDFYTITAGDSFSEIKPGEILARIKEIGMSDPSKLADALSKMAGGKTDATVVVHKVSSTPMLTAVFSATGKGNEVAQALKQHTAQTLEQISQTLLPKPKVQLALPESPMTYKSEAMPTTIFEDFKNFDVAFNESEFKTWLNERQEKVGWIGSLVEELKPLGWDLQYIKHIEEGVGIESFCRKAYCILSAQQKAPRSEYLYHGTNDSIIASVLENGLCNGFAAARAHSGGVMADVVGGTTWLSDYHLARNYAGSSARQHSGSNAIVFRWKTDSPEGVSKDLFGITEKPITPDQLEVSRDGINWIPAITYAAIPDYDTFIKEAALINEEESVAQSRRPSA